MSIKNRIKSILVEMNLEQLYGDLKSARAKALNLVHVGYGNWKNPARESFKWDDTQKLFVKIKSDEQKDTNPKKDPDPAEQKIKNQIKTKLEEPEDDYEIEKSGEDYGQKKMVSKNWAISYSTGGRYNTFEIYGDLENIGKRGKMVKSVEFTINSPSMGRTAWASTIEDAILIAKPKTFEELVDFMDKQTDIAKNTESEVRIYKNPVKEVKGVYSHIPDFGLEGDFESVQGADVGIKFSKPDIKIDSNMDSKEADKGHMRRFIEIKWTQAKKVNAIKDQLKSVVGLNNVAKVLTNNKIKFKTHSHMDGMYN